MKKNLKAGILAASALLSLGLLAGCGSTASTAAQSTTSTTTVYQQYMSDVHAIVDSISVQSTALAKAVKAQDSVAANAALGEIDTLVASLDKVSTPSALAEVQQDYKDGCTKLSSALRDYSDYYFGLQAAPEGDTSASDLQLQNIQSTYEAGISALKAGDALASSL